MKYYLGIDPGVSGGWAVIDENSRFVVGGLYERYDDIAYIANSDITKNGFACLEKVHSFPGQGVASTFKFGTNFGWWQGVLWAWQVPYELITPKRWMKAVLDSGDHSPEHRLESARHRWPGAPLKRKKDSGVADALWLAEYARLKHMGDAK